MNNRDFYKKRLLLVSAAIIAFLIIGNFLSSIIPTKLTSSYNHFYSLVEIGEAKNIIVSNTKVSYSDINGNSYELERTGQDDLINFLYHNDTAYKTRNDFNVKEIGIFLFSLLIAYALLNYLFTNKEKVLSLFTDKKQTKAISEKQSKGKRTKISDIAPKTRIYTNSKEKNVSKTVSKKNVNKTSSVPVVEEPIEEEKPAVQEVEVAQKPVEKPIEQPIKKFEPVKEENIQEVEQTKEVKKEEEEPTKKPKKKSNFDRPGIKHNRAGLGEKRGTGKTLIDIDSQVPIYKQHHKEELDD